MNLYIHIPFCAQRCSYCDFYTQTHLGLRVSFVEALCRELELRREELLQGESIKHVYLGGGTPSLLSEEELAQIVHRIRQLYPCEPLGEWTIECNPDDVSPDYARVLASLGFNRVSMGVQSFQEDDLKFLNRRHSVRQVYDAVDYLRMVGIENLSLDLIYGLPNQTEQTWLDNLRQILSLAPPHISAYHLIYEEGTPLTRLRDRGKVNEVSEELSLRFFSLLIKQLTLAGYEHYEVSNFAKPDRYACLNTGYWLGDQYIGLGPSAHSYDGASRSHNIASLSEYICALLDRGEIPRSREELSQEEKRKEFIMMRLRTQWGIPLALYANLFGDQAKNQLLIQASKLMEQGEGLCLQGEALRLTKSGLFISDRLIVDLW